MTANVTETAYIIQTIIEQRAGDLAVAGKCGKSLLQPTLAAALREGGFTADEEDTRGLLRSAMPVWRSKDNGEVVPTRGRRLVDIVVYKNEELVALIETESDLNDLRESGISRRSGHYDVASISRSASGQHFDSYNSLERMAAAAFYWSYWQTSGRYPSPVEAVEILESIQSNDRSAHNPAGLPLFLVSGFCRRQDPVILERRLKSLGAQLVCLTGLPKGSDCSSG